MKGNIRYFAIALFLISSCSHKAVNEDFNESTLEQLGVKQALPAKDYPFEEFYKTAPIHSFEFRPDKQAVYFLKNDGQVENVFEYDFTSQKISQITNFPEAVTSFEVDPKGRYLFLMRDKGGNEIYGIYKFDVKTKRTTSLANGNGIERSYLCDVTKDGGKLYFSQSREKRSYYDVKAVDLKTLKTYVVLKGNLEQLYCGNLDQTDQYLAFTRFIENNERHLGILSLADNTSTYIQADKNVVSSGANFADGNAYFLSNKDADVYRLWKYDLRNKKIEKVQIDLQNNLQGLGVFANGGVSLLRYRGELKPEVKLYQGLFKSQLPLPFLPETIKGAHFDEDAKDLGIVTVQDGAAPQKYYLFLDGKTQLIYDSNQSSIKSQDFSQSFSTFVTSFDGLKVPAHFFLPNGTSTQHKKPVIFWIHGGPEDHVDPDYSERIQFLVNNGFIVVAPNVRGSTGFGRAYQFKDNGDWGGGHIKDIVAVAEYTKKLPFVAANNVFILGGSFGGFSVMSLITQYPKVFNAAVDIFGPIDFATFLDSWPVNLQQYWLTELGKDPRVDQEFNKKVSPLYHLEKIQIPLQVHQGANDIRVPKSQSDKLIESMKRLGKPVEYHVYSDEGHGFTKFTNSKLCFTRSVDFFKKHLN